MGRIAASVIIDMSENEKKYWKGLEELHEEPAFLGTRSKEFAEELPVPFDQAESKLQASRRDFLKILGFSIGGTALASCTRMPVEKAIPYLVQPEEVIPGVANWYATTCEGCTASCPILVKTRDGRPIKIEGNPESPLTQGGLCAVGQAMVLSLYDDARLKGPLWNGQGTSWDQIDSNINKTLGEISTEGGKMALLTGTIVSPTTRELIGEFLKKYPGLRHVVYEPVSSAAIFEATEKSFGVRVLPHYQFDQAEMIVSLDADFLGTWISPVEFSAAYSRKRRPGEGMSRHVQFESRMSLTGANADLRVPVSSSEMQAVAVGLLKEVLKLSDVDVGAGSSSPQIVSNEGARTAPLQGKIIAETAKSLWNNRGQSLVVSGSDDVSTQIFVHALNSLLGNIGKTVDFDNPSFQKQGDDRAMRKLVDEMNASRIHALILYGVNPAYDCPESDRFVSGLKKTRLVISLSDRMDETSSLAHAVCPDHHFLESWNDAQPTLSHLSLTQPTLRPLFSTRSASESLLRWMGRTEDYYSYLRESWRKNYFPAQNRYLDFDSFWDHAVHDGVFYLPLKVSQDRKFSGDMVMAEAQQAAPLQDNQFELHLYEKITLRDGRHANNPWLQELPDPVTKITWDNYASMAPAAAKSLGLNEGDVVRLKNGKTQIEVPVQIQPGQSPRTISVALGYGRTKCGKVGEKVGVNAYSFVTMRDGLFRYSGERFTLEKTGRKMALAVTQTHHSMEGRPIIKEATLEEFIKNPAVGNEAHEKLVSLWAEKEKDGHAWGMAIDLSACTGCSACIIGCQSENNIAVVGKDEVQKRREMHWLRIDRYYNGSEDSPETVHQPMMCQHCGNAPCETVCPVLATTHSTDGLNQQIYNRCVGTRYCNNNCPYKVRRFNWFDYAHNQKFDYHMNSSLGAMVLNPDIVVRSRGVMEKCSMCIQRIQEGKLQAKREGRPLKDGDIRLACEQSCPSQAIVFGDLNNPESRVAKLNHEGRFYHVLEELNVAPVVGYLTKVRNK